MLAQVMDSRAPRELLREAAPELADRLAAVEDALDHAERLDLSGSLDPSGRDGDVGRPRLLDQRFNLARRRREILAEIRLLPGFTTFLLPPDRASLLRAAEKGPVAVVNASRYGCDALIVTGGGVRILPLRCTAAEAGRWAGRLADAVRAKAADQVSSCLDWVWDSVTEPVLDAAGPADRIWWCPTGPLTLLPLHAAGPALDRVISSYTPTLRALLRARDQVGGPRSARKVLLVGAGGAAGQLPLAGVAQELAEVRPRFPGAAELSGADATRDRVLAELPGAAWVHFACHATQELGDPSRARLVLHDEPLTVRELAARRLDAAEFAYLSGCETSRGGEVLADEAISIAATVQLAGFPHVIGTLWPTSDVHAPAVARDVYAVLTGDGTSEPHPDAAAAALHAAVRSLRERRPGFAIFWASYVHMGP